MRRLIGLAALLPAALILPGGGCVASLALAAGTLIAASDTAACALKFGPATRPVLSPAGPSSEVAAEVSTRAKASLKPCTAPEVGYGASVDPVTIPSPDAQSAIAVAAALTAVGRGGRYVAEGNGPVDFDCSGLTAWSWRQAGVSLVDYSYTQRAQTRDIPRALVQPGDLVFWFGSTEHHVAIVVAVDGGQISIAEAAC